MKVRFFLAFVLFGLFLLTGCGPTPQPVTPHKIENVSVVFFMGSGSYAVMTENPETKELTRHYFNVAGDGCKVKLFADCPPDKKMWVDVMPQQENNTKKMYVIHVRNINDVAAGNVGGKEQTPINKVK